MGEDFTGIIAIVFSKSRYLLIKNKETGNLTFPAGAREGNETPLQTLNRELYEETGWLSRDFKATETGILHEFIYNEKKKGRAGQKAKEVVYLVESRKTDLKPIDKDAEILGWFNYNEVIEKLTFEDSKALYKKIISLCPGLS